MKAMDSTMIAMITTAGAYLIGAVICFVRLEGKVKTNESLFREFQQNQKERDDRIEKAMSELRISMEGIAKSTNNIEGRMQGMS